MVRVANPSWSPAGRSILIAFMLSSASCNSQTVSSRGTYDNDVLDKIRSLDTLSARGECRAG